ncbi:hypothetical protein Dfri01_05540 [Dyadobacter frigoris]|nr:hypothetical protein Dfri01_05540 [Dyadobacter frigoris]
MFVAHKKLQAGKEYHEVKERVAKQTPAKTVVNKTVIIQSGQSAISYTKNLAAKVSNMVTLNERILEEGPVSFFETEEHEEINNSIATKLAGLIKQVIYAVVGSPSLSKS